MFLCGNECFSVTNWSKDTHRSKNITCICVTLFLLRVIRPRKSFFLQMAGSSWSPSDILAHETVDYDSGTRLLKLGFYPHFLPCMLL